MQTPLNLNRSRRDLTRYGMAMAILALGPAGARANTSFDAVGTLASHPIIGRWLAVTALGPADLRCDAGGDAFITWPHSGDGGLPGNYDEYFTAAAGAWRPISATEFDIVVVLGDTDDAGQVIGATILECHATVDDDGATFRATGPNDRLMRASFAAISALDVVTSLAPLSGIRMWPER